MAPFADDHLGERAELYALGVFDEAEADAVNAHAAGCGDCARLLGAAETAVTALDLATVPQVSPPDGLQRRIAAIGRAAPRPRVVPSRGAFVRFGALAAGLVLAVFGGIAGTRDVAHMHAIVAQDDVALAIIANSHFKHATLTKVDASAPTSKVLWGLTNRWVYVIVDTANCACRVVATTDAGERDLGVPLDRGATAVLFANDLPRVWRIELRRAGKIAEMATLGSPGTSRP